MSVLRHQDSHVNITEYTFSSGYRNYQLRQFYSPIIKHFTQLLERELLLSAHIPTARFEIVRDRCAEVGRGLAIYSAGLECRQTRGRHRSFAERGHCWILQVRAWSHRTIRFPGDGLAVFVY